MILGSLVKYSSSNIPKGEILQSDLNKIIDWSTANNMELHEKRFESFQTTLPGPHINKMVASARKVPSSVLGVFRDRSKDIMLQLYNSLISRSLSTVAHSGTLL